MTADEFDIDKWLMQKERDERFSDEVVEEEDE